MMRALLLIGLAVRLARCRRLLRAGRLDDCRRALDAVDRDFPDLARRGRVMRATLRPI